ncbi:AAA family ATPase [Bradyrhizobium liaoningense]|uniref:AAA family ATPase n=1 Tax=Bradyrhizobium liaoningense TaxID=43992 RepID=UPI00235B76AE|nr:AAA family ATPase [Bradyrhizobium liaoningense]GLR98968.1 hypothetical protein GCM10007858_66110 [Bradyrhizobium liaoningense]
MTDKNGHGRILAEFEKMRIKHSRLEQAYAVFDNLRKTRRDAPFEPKRWACIFAPTHSGKSTAVRMYLETIVAKDAIVRGLYPADMDPKQIALKQRIVLHISLEGVTNIKNLAQEILRALGGPTKGTTSDLLRLAYDYLNEHNVELLIIDELQHLMREKDKEKDKRGPSEEPTNLTNTLKTMLIRGLVPMAFVGIEEARSVVFNDTQLSGRCIKEIDYSRLDWTIRAEREIFENYCGAVGLKLKQHGLFEHKSDFMSGDVPICLHAASSGRVGIVSRIVEQAALIAVDDGSSQVLRGHLLQAVDLWAIPKNMSPYNLFREGLRKTQVFRR